ncbi:uncharacterized protein LOC114151911 isoform X1 [Xiphophorus couchianus]|uniref:uncharacterized protein LOC114151911 isoform X1 n=1 Tax=Xiphophorus couchianus TaxID=32473 RepID=UPI001016640B|nr:uncharacterized protein LOC114151911 isoform X1 [Xiphophorus couchianus]
MWIVFSSSFCLSAEDVSLRFSLTSGSCAVFCLVILLLVVVLYRKDLLCCRLRPCRTQEYANDLPQYSSRHSLFGIAHRGHNAALNQRAMGSQLPGTLFIIGKPNDYHLSGPQPRLPSYESVRKKDRQRQIHGMIARRIGLDSSHDEPPPTYEEIFYSNPQASPTNVHLSINASHSREETRGTAAQSYASVSPMGKEDPRCQDMPTGSANRTAV